MRKIFVFFSIFSVIFLFSCKKNTEKEFLVTGTLKNAEGKLLVLNKLSAYKLEKVDSTNVDKNGKFVLRGKTNELTYFLLTLNPEEHISLLIDSVDNINIEGDYSNFVKTYSVSGSDDSKLLQTLEKRLYYNRKRTDSLGAIYRANIKSPNLDSLKRELDKAFVEIMKDQKGFSIAFLEENNHSLACLMVLSQQIVPQTPVFTTDEDLKYFEMIDKSLIAAYPNNSNVKALHDFVAKTRDKTKLSHSDGMELGDIAPEISLPSPDGRNISLSSLRGKYVLLDFWASWCRPCRMENPNLVTNYQKYKIKGFEIYQVSLDQKKEDWVLAIYKDKLTWTHVSDLKFWNCEPAKIYGVRAIPANFLIDKDGKIIALNLRGEALGKKLTEIFGF